MILIYSKITNMNAIYLTIEYDESVEGPKHRMLFIIVM